MSDKIYDIAIIGGGINGCGIARDAAGRGLSVYLAEKNDLASGTSSASTKLIHGGLRYLEHYEFGLVRASLREREVLWGMAPHIIKPLRFVLPQLKGLRPAWLIRLGLFLYDHLGGRKFLPGTRSLDLTRDPAGAPLRPCLTRGFEYSDCWVDDARLVVLNASDAAARNAVIRTGTEVTSARRNGNVWQIDVRNNRTNETSNLRAHALVNASGPWIGDVIKDCVSVASTSRVRLVKGSHIVVPRLFAHDRAYIFQNADQRIIFAIPYEQNYTLIGTTDLDYSGAPEDARAEAEEISYLCEAASEYFADPVKTEDVVWSYSGIRPLYDDGASAAQEATRDYVLEVDGNTDQAVVINVFGGKITTYRKLAEAVLAKLDPWFPSMKDAWTRGATLPGGDFPVEGRDDLISDLGKTFPEIPQDLLSRLACTYGTLTREMLGSARTVNDLGQHFGAGLYQREVDYLVRSEWATCADDILWRRTKLGLGMTDQEVAGLSAWLKDNPANG